MTKQRALTDQELIDQGYKEGKKSFDHFWNNIIRGIEWDKIYITMKALDWAWCIDHNKDLDGIPTVKTLQQVAKQLLYKAWDRGIGRSSTGGFMCGWDNSEMWMTFSLTEYSTHDDK